jgi:hypothetical protein
MIHEEATTALADLLLALREERARSVKEHSRALMDLGALGYFPDVDKAQEAADRENADRALAGF